MIILAKSAIGHEFMYSASSAHEVSKKSATLIRDALNENKWNLKPNEIWHIHEVDIYDTAYVFAQAQKFIIRKGVVKRIGY